MNRKILIITGLLLSILLMKLYITSKSESTYAIKTFQIEKGWGYSIFNGNKIIIRQDKVPSIKEQKHFSSEQDALICGKIMLKKLQQKEIPSVTVSELQSNGIHL